jgi:hypothetical protein
MGLARGLLAFAGGFGQGYMQGQDKKRQRQLEEEKHAAEMKRLQLDTARLEDEQAMRNELKSLDSFSDKPAQAFVVQNESGRMVYTDEAMAKAHAASDATTQVVPAFVVNGKIFNDKHEAEQAAARQSTPAAKLAREATIYKKYGRNDMAAGAFALYQKELETNRQMVQQAFLDAKANGDVKSALNIYNDNLLNGAKADVQQGPNGELVVTRFRGGQQIGQTVFKTPDEFWATTEAALARTPANLFEAVRFDKEYGLRERGVAVQEGGLQNDTRRTDASVAHTAAQTADIPAAAADRRTQVGNDTRRTDATVRHLGAQTADIPAAAQDRRTHAQAATAGVETGQYNAETARLGLTKPAISAAPDGKGGLNFVAPTLTLDKQGNYTLGAPQVQAAQGLQYPAGYVAQQRNSLEGLGLGGAGTPQLDPNAVTNVMKQMEAEAARRKASRGQNPAAAPAPAPAPARSSSGPVTDLRKPVAYRQGDDVAVLRDLVVQQESGGRRFGPDGKLLTSPKGAKGEMQVLDATNTDPGYGVAPARDNSPEERARVGRDYLAAMVRKFGDVQMGLAAYNAGPGAVMEAVEASKKTRSHWLSHLPEETRNYVTNISRKYNSIRPGA